MNVPVHINWVSPGFPSLSVLSAHHVEWCFHSQLAINWCSPSLWKETEKKRGEINQAGRGSEGCGKRTCCCQCVCLPRPCPLPPRAVCPPAAVISWLSSSKETAKQGTVYLCRLYSLHIPAAGLRHHSNLPSSAKKGSADLLSTTVCIEVPGVQINRRQCPSSVRHCRPNNPTSPCQALPKPSLIHFQPSAYIYIPELEILRHFHPEVHFIKISWVQN